MKYVQRDFCKALAARLKGVDELKEAHIVVEDMADAYAEIQKASTGVVVAIAAVGHTRGTDASLAGRLDFEIICSEKPRVNRAGGRKDFLSAAHAAEIVAVTLDNAAFDGLGSVIYDAMDRRDEEDRAQMAVSLHAEQSLDPSEAVSWGIADGLQAYGRIITRRVARKGVAVFEPGRDGNDRYIGVRNRHLAIDLTANVVTATDVFPDIGETFTCPVKGKAVTFFCTASDTTEGVTDRTQIHLAGRTVTGHELTKGKDNANTCTRNG